MTDIILDEYVRVTRTIENIQTKINTYKKSIEEDIESAKSEEEQNERVKEFKNMMAKIKKDPNVTSNYRLLKKRQTELRNQIIPIDNNDIDKTISNLKRKYIVLSRKKIVFIDDNTLFNYESNN